MLHIMPFYFFVCVSMCVHLCVEMCMCIHVCACVCLCTWMCVCLCICICACVCLCVNVYVCICVYTCVFVCVCTRAHTCTCASFCWGKPVVLREQLAGPGSLLPPHGSKTSNSWYCQAPQKMSTAFPAIQMQTVQKRICLDCRRIIYDQYNWQMTHIQST